MHNPLIGYELMFNEQFETSVQDLLMCFRLSGTLCVGVSNVHTDTLSHTYSLLNHDSVLSFWVI